MVRVLINRARVWAFVLTFLAGQQFLYIHQRFNKRVDFVDDWEAPKWAEYLFLCSYLILAYLSNRKANEEAEPGRFF